MCGSRVHLPFEVDLSGEVEAHELEVAGESLDLLLLLLLEHGHGVPLDLGLEHELVAVLLILLVPRVLEHGLSRLLIDESALCTIHCAEMPRSHIYYIILY